MKRSEIQKTLENILSQTKDANDLEALKNQNGMLLNLVEQLARKFDELETTVQQQKDEINRLKGEQGKPNIRAQKR